LDVANQTLQITGSQILGNEGGGENPSGLYQIVELTADKMVLFVPNAAWATGWTWVFKPLK
jgi:hypothetical protein